MIVWLLVLLLLFIIIYVVYSKDISRFKKDDTKEDEQHFTLKI
jgi:uncharacterized membrane protein